MKTAFIALMLTSSAFASNYLSEAQVRETCLRNFARTITCSASVEGKNVAINIDKESMKAQWVNYFEYGVAYTGFIKTQGFFSRYPRWRISCNPTTGALEGTRLVLRNLIDAEHSVASVCR
jgi:hypothetical protein